MEREGKIEGAGGKMGENEDYPTRLSGRGMERRETGQQGMTREVFWRKNSDLGQHPRGGQGEGARQKGEPRAEEKGSERRGTWRFDRTESRVHD